MTPGTWCAAPASCRSCSRAGSSARATRSSCSCPPDLAWRSPRSDPRGLPRSRGPRQGGGMRVEILLFDGFDELDVFGPFEALRGPDVEVRLVVLDGPRAVVSGH